MHCDWRRQGLPKKLCSVLLLLMLVALTALPALAAGNDPSAPSQAATPAAPGPVAPAQVTPVAGPILPPDATAGRSTYQQLCAPCHGQSGDGKGPSAAGLNSPPAAFKDFNTVAGVTLVDLFNVAKNGRMDKMMPPWGQRLNDQQIWDVVGYAWSLHTSQAEVDAGKKLYDANCASCHGPDGKGTNGAPDLTNFAATSQQTQNDWVQVIAKGKGQMPAFADKLKADEQRAVGEYARSLSFRKLFSGALTGSGVITGTVINGTTGQVMPNLPIKLQIVQDDGTPAGERQATSDASGNYRFAELPTDATLGYSVSTEYPAGVPNQSTPTNFPANQTALAMPLHVFETTNEPGKISIDRVHYIIDFANGQLQVAELNVISHDGDKTYVGDANKAVLKFTLPPGAQSLDIADDPSGTRFKVVDGGFVDTQPLPPGNAVRQVLFRYVLPYTGNSYEMARTLPYPAGTVNALVTEAGEQVTSDQLANQGSRQSQMGNFINLVGQNLPANQTVSLKFTNLPAPGATTGGASTAAPVAAAANPTDRWMLVGLVVLVGAAAGFLAAWPLMRRRNAPVMAEAADDRDGLVDALARLDLSHEAGEISDGEYRDQRRRMKAQLLDLMRQEQGQ